MSRLGSCRIRLLCLPLSLIVTLSVSAAELADHQALAREIYAELIEINTTHS